MREISPFYTKEGHTYHKRRSIGITCSIGPDYCDGHCRCWCKKPLTLLTGNLVCKNPKDLPAPKLDRE